MLYYLGHTQFAHVEEIEVMSWWPFLQTYNEKVQTATVLHPLKYSQLQRMGQNGGIFFYNKLVMYSLADLYIFRSSLFTDFSSTFDFSFGQFFFFQKFWSKSSIYIRYIIFLLNFLFKFQFDYKKLLIIIFLFFFCLPVWLNCNQ